MMPVQPLLARGRGWCRPGPSARRARRGRSGRSGPRAGPRSFSPCSWPTQRDLLAERLLFDRLQEALDDVELDVGLEKAQAHVLERRRHDVVRQLALARQALPCRPKPFEIVLKHSPRFLPRLPRCADPRARAGQLTSPGPAPTAVPGPPLVNLAPEGYVSRGHAEGQRRARGAPAGGGSASPSRDVRWPRSGPTTRTPIALGERKDCDLVLPGVGERTRC